MCSLSRTSPWVTLPLQVYGCAYTAVFLDIQAQIIPITASSTEGRGSASGAPLLHAAWSVMARLCPWYAFCPVYEGMHREGGPAEERGTTEDERCDFTIVVYMHDS